MSEFPTGTEAIIETPEQIRQKERRELFERLVNLQEQYKTCVVNRLYDYDYIWKNIKDLSKYIKAAEIATEIKKILEKLNTQRPKGGEPLLFEIGENLPAAAALVDSYNKSGYKTEELQTAIVTYLEKFRSLFKGQSRIPGPKEQKQKETEWNLLEVLFEKFKLDRSKKIKDQRSADNLKKGLGNYLRNVKTQDQKDWEETEALIIERTEAIEKDNLMLSYYESVDDIEALLSSGKLLTIFELSEEEQGQKRKSLRSLSEIKEDRRNIEQALGWEEESTVYHLVLERESDRPQTNYGPVRLIFDFERLKNKATFTLGDSLNHRGVPDSIMCVTPSTVAESALDRQVTLPHLPLAKALFELASERDETYSPVRYVEAQVGGISGQEIMATLKEIRINREEIEKMNPETIERIRQFCESHKIIFSMS